MCIKFLVNNSDNLGGQGFQKYICFIDYAKAFDCVDQSKLSKILRDGNTRSPYLFPEKMRVMKQRTGSKLETGHGTMTGSILGKEYVKAVYCHPAYLTSM